MISPKSVVDETKVWHILDNQNKLSVNSDFVIDCSTKNLEETISALRGYHKNNEQIKNVQHTLIRYEDLLIRTSIQTIRNVVKKVQIVSIKSKW